MWSRLMGLSTAAAATLIVVGIGAAVAAPLVYFILVFAEGLIEGIGLIARGWGAAHEAAFLWTAGLTILVAGSWVAIKYFRNALEVETELRRSEPPPAA